MYELCIIGGGPAGISAGIYAARKHINTSVVSDKFGGQSMDSALVENWIGEKIISGYDLGKKMEAHLRKYESDKLKIFSTRIEKIEEKGDNFELTQNNKEVMIAKTILYAAGSTRRKLPATGADKFEHKGLTYCASCDGPIFTDKNVIVVGGGNSALETALQLVAYCKNVTIINRTNKIRGDAVTLSKLKEYDNLEIIYCAEITEVKGDKFVNSIDYKKIDNNTTHSLDIEGIFVEIGLIPSTQIITGLVEFDDFKRIKIDPWTQKTTHRNIWAAGDCTNILYHQNNIASGNAVAALENIYVALKTNT